MRGEIDESFSEEFRSEYLKLRTGKFVELLDHVVYTDGENIRELALKLDKEEAERFLRPVAQLAAGVFERAFS